jgi:hypothetical protein
MAYVIVLLELLQKHILPIPSITTKHDIVHMNHHATIDCSVPYKGAAGSLATWAGREPGASYIYRGAKRREKR